MNPRPPDAPDPTPAFAFMNYLLRPEVTANITNTVQYANGNENAEAVISPGLWSDTTVYADGDMLSGLCVMSQVPVNFEG
ncbi:spermidine/putrescine ABC transporter substrate-binding protein PotF, partial [Pseudomonas syringae pv. tagetis]